MAQLFSSCRAGAASVLWAVSIYTQFLRSSGLLSTFCVAEGANCRRSLFLHMCVARMPYTWFYASRLATHSLSFPKLEAQCVVAGLDSCLCLSLCCSSWVCVLCCSYAGHCCLFFGFHKCICIIDLRSCDLPHLWMINCRHYCKCPLVGKRLALMLLCDSGTCIVGRTTAAIFVCDARGWMGVYAVVWDVSVCTCFVSTSYHHVV